MDASTGGARGAMYAAGIPDGPGHGLSLVMDELAHGVLLASAKGQVLHANQAARQELALARVLTVQEGHLHTTDAAQSKVLVQGLARAETGRRSLIALRTASRHRVSIAVVPLRPERLQATCSVALLFSRASVCD